MASKHAKFKLNPPADYVYGTDASGRRDWKPDPSAPAGGIPAGAIVMWSGTLAAIPATWALCDGTNGTPDLRDRFIKSVGAAENPGATGGSATHDHGVGSFANAGVSAGTPTGSVSAPTFTGDAMGTHSHGVGTLATSTHSGTAVADHASHTHTYTDVVNHTHTVNVGSANDISSTTGAGNFFAGTTASVVATTANPTGGVATGTTAGPSAVLTHSVTQPSDHTLSGDTAAVSAGTPTGTISTPTFTGSALGTHTHTISGTSATASSEPEFFKLAFIMKL